jgi:hypothetical protein
LASLGRHLLFAALPKYYLKRETETGTKHLRTRPKPRPENQENSVFASLKTMSRKPRGIKPDKENKLKDNIFSLIKFTIKINLKF